MSQSDLIFTSHSSKRVEEPVEVSLPYNTICGVIPCTRTRKEVRIDTKYQTYFVQVDVPTCCSGYAENAAQECAPICLDPCRHGKCVAPNTCKCNPPPSDKSPGYIGHTCGQFSCLNNNRWGANCDLECDCPSLTSYCHAETGKCFCKTGWRGQDCSEPCKANDDDCPDSPLLPVVDPEVNAIPSARFERLQSISARGLNLESSDPSIEATNKTSNSYSSFVMANMGLNLLLAASTFFLILSVFWYKKRLNEVQNEIYYAPSSTTSSSGNSRSSSSGYTAPSTRSNSSSMAASQSYHKGDRPPMPLPGAVDFFRKTLNLSPFYEHSDHLKATPRANSTTTNSQDRQQASYLLNPKLESHLIGSQKKAQPNFYSDAQVTQSESGRHVDKAFIPINNQASNMHLLGVVTSSQTNTSSSPIDDTRGGHYQVPKSPSPFKQQQNESISSQLSDDYSSPLSLTSETNIYEEIKPRLPDRPALIDREENN